MLYSHLVVVFLPSLGFLVVKPLILADRRLGGALELRLESL